ncbi:thiol peroxidase [Alishewanella sp. HH-ZS]|uniref:thiol peroxidase n=1 Tax=Alishewanella sp. HH-ZS TaxID=1856684 RepID=UPI0008235B8D|nr:thiol peroxidase [Alishewanella sp. HH-ZS]OCW97087.1 lipid hydroperoxide peroxidase [Alishewanella sp. HH-ZS]
MFIKRKNNTKILFTLMLAAAAFFSQAIDITANLPARISDVKAGGQQIVLLGDELKVGQQAPDFRVVDNSFKPVRLSDFQGKTLMLSIVPSIDTGICSLQTKRFNEEVAKLPDSVQLLTISTDLPFAQKRFCEQEQVNNMAVLSDAVWRDFGSNYGLLIKDMGLLTRAIIIINQQGKVAYLQLVPELAQEPDYDAALQVLRQTIGS